jgi:hypothetical protein
MRAVLAVMLCLSAPFAAAGESPLRVFELTGSTGFSDGPGYAARSPHVAMQVGIGTSWLRANAGASHGWLHKAGTSGGYQRSYSFGAEIGRRNAFLFGGTNRNFTDQTEYTKTVNYGFGGAGFRWAGSWRGERAVSINEVRVIYYRETYSTYANRTEQYAASYSWDRMLRGALYLRLSFKLGAVYYDDNPYPGAQRRNGLASSLNIGIVARP